MKLIDFILLLFRSIAMIIGMALNMKRVLSSSSDSLDDMLFILSIMTGLIIGIYWDPITKPFNIKI